MNERTNERCVVVAAVFIRPKQKKMLKRPTDGEKWQPTCKTPKKKKRNKSTYTTSGKKIRSFISVSRESLKNKKKNSGHVNITIRQVALVLELLVALLEKQEKNVAPSFMLLLLIFRGCEGLCSCFV